MLQLAARAGHLQLYHLNLATDEQKDQAQAQFERAFQVLELLVREQRSTTLAIVHAAAGQQYPTRVSA